MKFKKINGLNYEVSPCGVVRNYTTKKVIKANPGGTSPYMVVNLKSRDEHGNKIQLNRLVHRLIAQAFIPNPLSKKQVNHKNGNKVDNRIENLEWVTQEENMQHAYDTGLKTYRPLHYKGKTGFQHNRSKAVRCVQTGQVFGSMSEAGRGLGIDISSVSWSLRHDRPIKGMKFELIT
jgi:hypothetical protein